MSNQEKPTKSSVAKRFGKAKGTVLNFVEQIDEIFWWEFGIATAVAIFLALPSIFLQFISFALEVFKVEFSGAVLEHLVRVRKAYIYVLREVVEGNLWLFCSIVAIFVIMPIATIKNLGVIPRIADAVGFLWGAYIGFSVYGQVGGWVGVASGIVAAIAWYAAVSTGAVIVSEVLGQIKFNRVSYSFYYRELAQARRDIDFINRVIAVPPEQAPWYWELPKCLENGYAPIFWTVYFSAMKHSKHFFALALDLHAIAAFRRHGGSFNWACNARTKRIASEWDELNLPSLVEVGAWVERSAKHMEKMYLEAMANPVFHAPFVLEKQQAEADPQKDETLRQKYGFIESICPALPGDSLDVLMQMCKKFTQKTNEAVEYWDRQKKRMEDNNPLMEMHEMGYWEKLAWEEATGGNIPSDEVTALLYPNHMSHRF